MKTIPDTPLHVCGHCKRTLPLTEFYFDRKTNKPSNYCKECRREASRALRKRRKPRAAIDCRPADYPVITQVEDSQQRMALILHAVRCVRESVLRKRKKRIEAELLAETSGMQ